MGNDEVTSLREVVRDKVCRVRSFYRLVLADEFAEALISASVSVEQMEIYRTLLSTFNYEGLKVWIKNNLPKELENMSYRKLRDMAKDRNIPRWSRLSREELIEALHEDIISTDRKIAERTAPTPSACGIVGEVGEHADRGDRIHQTSDVY